LIPWWDVKVEGTELSEISKVLDSGFLNEGPITENLEKSFSGFLNVKHCVFTTSGTIALFLALRSAGIGPGDLVAVPNLTFIATANAVKLCGAEVLLVDTEENTLNISNEALQLAIMSNQIDALVVVHVSGRSAFSEPLLKTIELHGLRVIEDAAEAFGSKDPISGKHLGTIGVAGAYSFSPNKVITSGQGGAVVTNDTAIAQKIRELKDQGRPKRGTGGADLHPGEGFNFKFTDLQAAILASQFKSMGARLQHLRDVYTSYSELLEINDWGGLLGFEIKNGEVPLWPEYHSKNRESMLSNLESKGIGYRRIWHPISSQDHYRTTNEMKNSTKSSRSVFWLPSSFNLSRNQLEFISETINTFNRVDK
jgi:perosamine synthetase